MSNQSAFSQERLRDLSPERVQLLKLLREERSRQAQRITRVPRAASSGEAALPTSWAQQRLWFVDQLERGSAAYHITQALRLRGALNQNALQAALDAIVQRHEALRTRFVLQAGEPSQQIAPSGRFPLEAIDLSAATPGAREQQLSRHKLEAANDAFDLELGPLVRARLLRLGPQEHALLITMHHIVSDGWSMGVFVRELATLYRALREGGHDPLAPLPIQYGDYAQWQRQWLQQHEQQRQLALWRDRLSGVEPLELPTDRPRPPAQSYRGRTQAFALDAALSGQLRALAQRHGMTLFMLLHAAWAILLSRLSGQEDIAIGTPVANRQRPEVEDLIGFFVNTLVLRVSVRGEQPLAAFLADVKETTLWAYDHQDVPFEQVVEALQPQRSLDRNPLFQVMLTLRNAPRAELTLADLTVTVEDDGYSSAMFDLLVVFEERGESIDGLVNYATDLFDPATIERWLACFQVLLRALPGAQHRPLVDLPLLPEAEGRLVVESFNATELDYPQAALVHRLFEEWARRTPEAIAVMHGAQRLTFAEIDREANALAWLLRDRGVAPDQPVGICIERGAPMVIGLLGILKAGGAYLPLDPQYPRQRLEQMISDAAPKVILTNAQQRALLPEGVSELIMLDGALAQRAGRCDAVPDRNHDLTPANLIYVIYTSGSTGRPKGAAMSHGAMVNLIEWQRRALGEAAGRRVLQFAALSFDVAFQETFSTLCTGGTLVLLDEWVRRDARALMDLLAQSSIERVFLPPLMLQSLAECSMSVDAPPRALRDVITAGEQLRITPEIVSFFERIAPCRLHNHYGPTETHVVTALSLEGDPRKWPTLPSIGRPIANSRIYILDPLQRPAPVGVRGEIYIGGAGVARGYLRRPELTAQRFVPDPFDHRADARLYRTGDLGRWRADGTLEYLGRNDFQVKIRGFRIELGEIEAQLALHEHVKEAAVIAREDAPGAKRLVAYVTARGKRIPEADEMRARLKAALPEHMVPSAFVVLEKLPLTPSGKLDRRSLPAPQLERQASAAYQAPQGETERLLASVWGDLLRIEQVGRLSDFFELGGHSLLIVRMVERLRAAGCAVKVRQVYESPVLADLAHQLDHETSARIAAPPNLIPDDCEAITPQMLPLVSLAPEHIARIAACVPGGVRNIKDIYPLAPLQEGMLFHHLVSENGVDAYGRSLLISFASHERLKQFAAALGHVIERHDILRTALLWEGLPQPVQVVLRAASLPVEPLTLDAALEPLGQLQQFIRSATYRLDLRRAPLIRLLVAPDARSAVWYAILWTHHVTFDNQSMNAMLSEVMASLEGRVNDLPEPVPYRHHVAQALAYARAHDPEAFFRSKLGDVDAPTAPFGVLEARGEAAAEIERAREPLAAATARRVREAARTQKVSAATVFHAAWALVIAGASGRDDVVFGTVLLGRSESTVDTRRMLGMMINTLPLRLKLRELTVDELMRHTQTELIDLMRHEQAPLAAAQRASAVDAATPLFSALLNYWHGAADVETDVTCAAGVTLLDSGGATNYPMTLSVADLGEEFRLDVKTDRRIDAARVVRYVQTAVASLVDALERAPQTRAITLSILPQEERRQLLQSFNDTFARYPAERLVHELFEEQARRAPAHIAVACGDAQLTFAALNARANQWARWLRKRGVRRGERVALYMERSIELVLAILATLKAGGAYVPFDARLPAERLMRLLEDAAPALVLTMQRLRPALPPTHLPVVALDLEDAAVRQEEQGDLECGELASTDVAYLMYTSGSTGEPKGVMVCHRNLVNYASYAARRFEVAAGDGALIGTSMSFDLSLTGFYPTLLCGRPVRLLADDEDLSQRLLAGANLAPVKLTPTHLATLTLSPERIAGCVRTLVLGGEQLHASALQWWRLHSPQTRIFNHYGPTEATIGCVVYEIPPQLEGPAPIGRPIANTRIYILDAHRQPVPIGVVGEIYVAGAGVALGYWRRPELTEQRFLPDPFSEEPDARMYRTGDLGRWRADAVIEYLGRNDQQIKIRGFRVELGEIETHLRNHPHVREAAVIAREDAPGDQRLVAYIVTRDGESASIDSLRACLKTALPDYMVPGAFVTLASLPLTPNGKLDRRALPMPGLEAYARRDYEPPHGEVEQALGRIWQALLGTPRIGRDDNFFELGGHSLHGIKLIAAIAVELQVRLPLVAVFQHPTLRQMAQHIASLRLNAEPFEEGVIDPPGETVLENEIAERADADVGRP